MAASRSFPRPGCPRPPIRAHLQSLRGPDSPAHAKRSLTAITAAAPAGCRMTDAEPNPENKLFVGGAPRPAPAPGLVGSVRARLTPARRPPARAGCPPGSSEADLRPVRGRPALPAARPPRGGPATARAAPPTPPGHCADATPPPARRFLRRTARWRRSSSCAAAAAAGWRAPSCGTRPSRWRSVRSRTSTARSRWRTRRSLSLSDGPTRRAAASATAASAGGERAERALAAAAVERAAAEEAEAEAAAAAGCRRARRYLRITRTRRPAGSRCRCTCRCRCRCGAARRRANQATDFTAPAPRRPPAV